MLIGCWLKTWKERNNLKEIGVDRIIILKWILKNYGGTV
jgi:hypothetical protein